MIHNDRKHGPYFENIIQYMVKLIKKSIYILLRKSSVHGNLDLENVKQRINYIEYQMKPVISFTLGIKKKQCII